LPEPEHGDLRDDLMSVPTPRRDAHGQETHKSYRNAHGQELLNAISQHSFLLRRCLALEVAASDACVVMVVKRLRFPHESETAVVEFLSALKKLLREECIEMNCEMRLRQHTYEG
jgi:hypothetical protein